MYRIQTTKSTTILWIGSGLFALPPLDSEVRNGSLYAWISNGILLPFEKKIDRVVARHFDRYKNFIIVFRTRVRDRYMINRQLSRNCSRRCCCILNITYIIILISIGIIRNFFFVIASQYFSDWVRWICWNSILRTLDDLIRTLRLWRALQSEVHQKHSWFNGEN